MREKGKELILRRIGRDQLLPLTDVAGLVFDQKEHALYFLFRVLKAEEIDVHEIGNAGVVEERLLDQLKGRSERKHFLDRSGRCDPDLGEGCFPDLFFRRQISQAPRHLSKGFVRLQELPRLGIDQGDAARHA